MTRIRNYIKNLTLLVAVGLLTGLLLLLTACGNAVAAPNVDKFKIDQTNKLTWEAISGARSYVLEIKNVESNEVEEVNAKRTSYSLANLLEGDYEIRIKAVAGNKNAKDSEWSEICYFSKEYETGCIYKLVNNVEYHISKIGSAMDNIVIEAKYRNKPVTAILDTAFKGSTKITGITIGENVQSIGKSAFYNCSNLTYVDFSNAKSLTTIGKAAFQNCRSLKEITLPSSVTAIDEYTFAYCRGLETIDLGESIQSIGNSAFSDCSALTSVEIPDSVTALGEYAFSENDLLESIHLGNGVQTIGQYAFWGCKALTNVRFGEESKLTTILDCAFRECSALTAIQLPQGLKEIGANAFYMSTALEQVVIPDSVEYVRKYAFHSTKLYFDALAAEADFIYADKWVVDCTIKERPETMDENAPAPKVLQKITKESFDRQIVGIADRTFYGCTDLESVVLGESVKHLGERAFSHCSSLYSIDLSGTAIKKIGVRAFEYCKYLSKVKLGKELPSGDVISPVERIEEYAFSYCERLINTLSGEFIPEASETSKGITSIGQKAFYKTGLWNSPTAGVIYAGNWVVGYSDENISEVTLKEGTVGIAEYAFYNCNTLTAVKSLNLAKYIGRGAFSKCSSLDRVILNRDLDRIEPYTFYGCSALFDISLPLKLQSIGKSAFAKCEKLNGLNFQTTRLKTIEEYAFNACTNIESIVFNEEIENIGAYAFYKCTMLHSLTLPDSVKELGNRAFGNCTKLGSITLGNGLTKIGERAFQNAQELKKIVIPSNVVEIGNYAFYKCFNVEEIVLEEGVEIIGDSVFFGLNKLQRLTLPSSVKSIGKYAFKGCEYLQSVVIGENVETIGAHAFYGCKQLTVYLSTDSLPSGWHARWNSSYRPVIWGCEMEEGYVQSVTIGKDTISKREGHVIVSPKREGYTFVAWRAEIDGVEVTYTADKIDNPPEGTTLYATWTEGDEPLIKIPGPEEPSDSSSASDSTSDSTSDSASDSTSDSASDSGSSGV